jgi:chemotaxis protein MotB
VTIAAAKAIKAEILSRFGSGHQALPANLDVTPTFEGVMISLTDSHEFGMFALGSAEPDPKLVTLIATIAEVLNGKQGFVVVRGHTDARPYRNKKYDNWQLSTARAHMAVYMLERGGLEASRIKRVEGHADRDLKDPGDPQSEENRRIEILIGGLAP